MNQNWHTMGQIVAKLHRVDVDIAQMKFQVWENKQRLLLDPH